MYKEVEDEMGYAKIEGPNIKHIITKTKVILGRDSKMKDTPITENEQFIYLGPNQKISRKHLMIYYEQDKFEWYAQNLSKNPVNINREIYNRGEEPKCISPIASIQIDEIKFYFFQSKEENN